MVIFQTVSKEALEIVVIRSICKLETFHVSQIGAELPIDPAAELGGGHVLLDVPDHLVTLPHVVGLQPHPWELAQLHEVDEDIAYGLHVVPPTLLHSVVSVY